MYGEGPLMLPIHWMRQRLQSPVAAVSHGFTAKTRPQTLSQVCVNFIIAPWPRITSIKVGLPCLHIGAHCTKH